VWRPGPRRPSPPHAIDRRSDPNCDCFAGFADILVTASGSVKSPSRLSKLFSAECVCSGSGTEVRATGADQECVSPTTNARNARPRVNRDARTVRMNLNTSRMTRRHTTLDSQVSTLLSPESCGALVWTKKGGKRSINNHAILISIFSVVATRRDGAGRGTAVGRRPFSRIASSYTE
jgi:hypothetical protein